MSSFKDKVTDAAHAVSDAAKDVGHKIADGATHAVDYVKEKAGMAGTTNEIRPHMPVIASCGKQVGVVDHMDGASIKLTKKDSADGLHHFIPAGWVDHVDTHVHLSKNSQETERDWKSSAM